MLSVKRNRLLGEMAAQVRKQPELLAELRTGDLQNQELLQVWQSLRQEFGDLFCGAASCSQGPEALAGLIGKMAAQSPRKERSPAAEAASLKNQFLSRFSGPKRTEMAAYLDLARASYRLRDDDNLHLGKVKAQLLRAVEDYQRRRAETQSLPPVTAAFPPELGEVLAELADKPRDSQSSPVWAGFADPTARQLVGQPASPGLAQGKARVVLDSSELLQISAGDILVCDAVDPTMTFVVPLVAAIVERRGGMLIHGSIIAREYGIPCVTGVPQATSLIHAGDPVTVDGYLGIVIIG
jgi:phosphohistidine swiveling domain-containing protein